MATHLTRYQRLSPEQKEAKREYQRKYRRENRELVLENGRRSERRRKLKRYGLTEESYQQLLTKQGNVCGICGNDNNNGRDWHVDHCHNSNKVRGILCHHCNLLLGNAKDDITTLHFAISYLERSRKQ